MQPKVVIVTGGADGFGAAISDRFSQEGCQVIILDTNKAKGESKSINDSNLNFLLGDVTRVETWEQALTLAREKFGRLDVVVNNAGITGKQSLVHTKDMLEYEKTFNVNVKACLLTTSSLFYQLIRETNDKTANISECSNYCALYDGARKWSVREYYQVCLSPHGLDHVSNGLSTGCTRPRPGFAFYNASKAAVNVATKTMALEYAPTIRFNCIAPAVGNTSMLQASIGNGADSKERLQKIEDMLPMKRVTQPEDIANAVWYLASDQSSFVTGTTLEVDGGRGV